MKTIEPLKQQFKPQYWIFTKDEITERVRSEDNYTFMKGWPLTEFEDKEDTLCPRVERLK